MKNRPWDILAAIELFPTGKGGRQGPTPSGTFNCMMQFDDLIFDVRLDLEHPLAPGEKGLVPIRFLDPALAKSHCSVGTSFVLREVTPIGEGFVQQTAFFQTAT